MSNMDFEFLGTQHVESVKKCRNTICPAVNWVYLTFSLWLHLQFSFHTSIWLEYHNIMVCLENILSAQKPMRIWILTFNAGILCWRSFLWNVEKLCRLLTFSAGFLCCVRYIPDRQKFYCKTDFICCSKPMSDTLTAHFTPLEISAQNWQQHKKVQTQW